ncbi:MAG: N-acetylmuramoyl-L-alanine amidase [Bacteroidota bacterium]
MLKSIGLPLVLIFGMVACKTSPPSSTLPIKSWPIVFDEDRTQLSLDYMQEHYGMTPEAPTIDPKMVVVHWTAIPTLQASYEAFHEARLPASRATIGKASPLNVSVPYLIDRDGAIFQLMPDTLFARHVIGLNHCAIGIENVGDGGEHPLTEAQFVANVQLIKQLLTKYNIQYVIGHYEYQQFIGHPLWKEKDASYLTEKSDPGDAFMQRIRSELSDFNLLPLPAEDSIRQGISGQVRWYEGNLMPTVGDAPAQQQGKAVQRRIHIYELTHRDQAKEESVFFSNISTKQVATVATDSLGQFQLSLPVGKYSVLVEEENGLFANRFDGEGNIAPVEVEADEVIRLELKIDYRATY